MTNDIVRVWGTADDIDLEFYEKDGRWVQNLPPDLVDGQYAAMLYAQNSAGRIGIWSGMLYMCDGLACLHLKKDPYTFWLLPENFAIRLLKECPTHDQPIKTGICSR